MSSDSRSTRYWCHICNSEVSIFMAPDPTCIRCNEQFIEEVQSDDDPREFLTGTDNDSRSIPEFDFTYARHGRTSGDMGDDIFQYFTPTNVRENNQENQQRNAPLNNLFQNLFSNMLGSNMDFNSPQSENGRQMVIFGNLVDGDLRFQPMPGSLPTRTEENNNNNDDENSEETRRNNNNNNMSGLLQFLSALTGAPFDGGMVGNPNDYVFSQTALDNIITQLMEQAGSGSAPPPAPEDVIDALVKRTLNEREKSQEADCAVCKDQFEANEQVIELPCDHIFHDDCIKPWLKLNSTCPVCRHSVITHNNEQESNSNNNRRDSTHNSFSFGQQPGGFTFGRPPTENNNEQRESNRRENNNSSFTFGQPLNSGFTFGHPRNNDDMPAAWPSSNDNNNNSNNNTNNRNL